MKSFLVIGNVIVCGFLTFFISMFFASGTIAENYTDKTYVAPEFFLIIPIWIIGASLQGWYFSKNKIKDTSYGIILLINFLLWFSIPIGFMFAMLFL